MKKILVIIIIIVVVIAGYFVFKKGKPPEVGTLTSVRFGMLPYGDHSQAIIAAQKGWFKDVGIDFKYELIKVEGIIPELNSGRLDAASCAPGILLSSYDNAKGICMFTFADVFQGYAVVGQPGGNYKGYDDFIASGMTPKQAIIAAVSQLKGKTFAYPSETAIKPFIDIILAKSGLSKADFKSLVQDDAVNINAMRNKQADFQVGGVPSRITLQKEGYKQIISSIDIVKAAVPSPESKELSSVFNDGWAVTKDYYAKNKETVLRLASVNYRINDYINQHPDSALAIHMPYLSKITGEKFSVADGLVIYKNLDPFYNFEAQRSWFTNEKDPLYYKNLYGSIINSFKAQGVYKNAVPAIDDIVYADDVYKTLDSLKTIADQKFKKIESNNTNISSELKEALTKAHFQYQSFNYLDAVKILETASK